MEKCIIYVESVMCSISYKYNFVSVYVTFRKYEAHYWQI